MPVEKFSVLVTGIEQYARPGTGTGSAAKLAPGRQFPLVRVTFAPEPLPSSAAINTGKVGKLVYAPGSMRTGTLEILPPATVAVNFAGMPAPP